MYIYIYTNIYTLTETKKYIAPEKFTQLKTQKDFPTIQFQGRFVSFREGSKNDGCPVGYARCPGGVLKEPFFFGESFNGRNREVGMSGVMNSRCDLLNYKYPP